MRELANKVFRVYQDHDRGKYLDNLFRLQMVAGQYPEAIKSIASLREVQSADDPARSAWINVQYEIYADAKAKQDAAKLPFDEAFRQSFRGVLGRLDDRVSALVIRALSIADKPTMRRNLEGDLARQKGKSSISLADALKLIHDYQTESAYKSFTPLVAPLIAEDDRRRYVIQKDVPVKTPDGATICTLVVRPRASGRLPTLLNFTIYADPDKNMSEARRTASNSYCGVVGLTRGKGCSRSNPVPYEHDGSDAAALIDWISKQAWSDGRVGMYGGSYEGFTQWAAAKQMPKALKALMPGAPVAPGIDVPMEGNVFWNFIYPYPFYTTNTKYLDDATWNDTARWNRLNRDWYMSGRAYRDLEKIDGTPNPIFDRWIRHSSYDAYWRNMIPYKNEFARIKIPVLTTAGYYYGGPGAAVYYFTQHYKYNPNADHYLIIGPYDHIRGHRGTVGVLGDELNVLSGYKLDPVAQIDMGELRYQWFDYVFKGGPKPALLKDKVNYQVMGANAWNHAPTLAGMSNRTLRFQLSAARSGDTYRLSESNPSDDTFVTQTVNLADRSDVDRDAPGGGVLDKAVDVWNGAEFVSDPLPASIEISGLFSGRLDFVSNKKDFDFEVDLYALTPMGDYVQLAPYWARASYIGDLSQRRLLVPGKRQQLNFQSVRLMSRQVEAGSRLVAVLRVIKEPGREINYGTGKNVIDETVSDAKEPLHIEWYTDSFVEVPVK
jgi:putative CocE/NonD family hydrolase